MCKARWPTQLPYWSVNKFWMFVYDSEVRDGQAKVALVKPEWDGVVDRTDEELGGYHA